MPVYRGPNLGNPNDAYGKTIEDRISMILGKPFEPVRPDPSMSPPDPYAPKKGGQQAPPIDPRMALESMRGNIANLQRSQGIGPSGVTMDILLRALAGGLGGGAQK